MKVTNTPLGQKGVEQLRKIVSESQAGKVHGRMVDGYTASMLVQLYDGVKPENKIKIENLPLPLAVSIGWKVFKGVSK